MLATLISLSGWLLDKAGAKIFDTLFDSTFDKDEVDKSFKKILLEVSKVLEKKYPGTFGGDISILLNKNEIYEELYKFLFINSKIDSTILSEHIDFSTLPTGFLSELIKTLRLKILLDPVLSKIFSNKELYLVIIGVGKNVQEITNYSTLSLEEIQKIRKILETRFNEDFSVSEFVDSYLKVALQNFSELNFIGLGLKSHIKKNRKKLQDVYVKPFFSILESSIEYSPRKRPLHISRLFDDLHNLVILGDPGSGKSILVKYLICACIQKKEFEIRNKSLFLFLPFRIELRKYLQYKKLTNNGLENYLCKSFETDFGLYSLDRENLAKVFESYKPFIFFDGLDEIFNNNDRILITTDIENFADLYKEGICIVTSRIIGYEEAPLDKEKFKELKIVNFNDTQIREYVTKWYFQEESDQLKRDNEINEFIRLSKNVDKELTRNPLLLSLIVILYRNNLRLPESKLEIYQSCTKTLVDKWDSHKDLALDLDEELAKWKESLFADLAYWQYNKLSSKNLIITNEAATNEIAKSIFTKLKLTNDWIVAKDLAEQFMSYALKRSLYFDNNFTHKTFLEYFTAYWIFSNIEKKHKIDERNEIISKYIDNPFWAIVLELFINMIDQDQADFEVIDTLYEEQLQNSLNAIPFLISILSSIKYKSKQNIQNLFDATINFIINTTKAKLDEDSLQIKIFNSLRNLNSQNLISFFEILSTYSTINQLNDSAKSNIIILYGELALRTSYYPDATKFLSGIINHLELINKNPLMTLLYRNMINNSNHFEILKKFLSQFGESSTYNEYAGKFDNYEFISPINMYFIWQLSDTEIANWSKNLNELFKIGVSKIHLLKYLMKDEAEGYFIPVNITPELAQKTFKQLTDDFLKAILILVIFISEGSSSEIGALDEFSSYFGIQDFKALREKLIDDFSLQKYI